MNILILFNINFWSSFRCIISTRFGLNPKFSHLMLKYLESITVIIE